ncbi:MAG: uncharacterized protein JWO86_3234 [Myxococcaceae bacterium]|nr:uncharacterized protein [Myxococcaceae bacterium]
MSTVQGAMNFPRESPGMVTRPSVCWAPILALSAACCVGCGTSSVNPVAAPFRSETVWQKPVTGCPADAVESETMCAVCNPRETTGCSTLCGAGNGDACAFLGTWNENRDDYAHAATLHERACDLGSGKGCEGLARLLMRGQGRPKDETRGVDLVERMCRAGRPRACTSLAEAVLAGRGGRSVDTNLGMRLLEASCEKHEPEACQLLRDPRVREDVDAAVAAARARIAACPPDAPDIDACRAGKGDIDQQ